MLEVSTQVGRAGKCAAALIKALVMLRRGLGAAAARHHGWSPSHSRAALTAAQMNISERRNESAPKVDADFFNRRARRGTCVGLGLVLPRRATPRRSSGAARPLGHPIPLLTLLSLPQCICVHAAGAGLTMTLTRAT